VASPLIHAASTLLSMPIRAASSCGPSNALALAIKRCAVLWDTIQSTTHRADCPAPSHVPAAKSAPSGSPLWGNQEIPTDGWFA